MQYIEVFLSQISDPFRIGLLAVLVITAFNTAAQTGFVLPLLLGTIFVAILIPAAMGDDSSDLIVPTVVGLFSNVLILAVVMAVRLIFLRLKGSDSHR
ncbi:hypothetical protein NKH36_08540 [Mesorhizobium sp. M1312]|uniref:hypothetical protein n=1 Tax=unclassified Mesorhizobium TaxID=325217 RepID=UPI00333C1277